MNLSPETIISLVYEKAEENKHKARLERIRSSYTGEKYNRETNTVPDVLERELEVALSLLNRHKARCMIYQTLQEHRLLEKEKKLLRASISIVRNIRRCLEC